MYGAGSRPPLTTRHRTTAYGTAYGGTTNTDTTKHVEGNDSSRRRGRSSLSALDEKRAEAMRNGVLTYMTRYGSEPHTHTHTLQKQQQQQHGNPTTPAVDDANNKHQPSSTSVSVPPLSSNPDSNRPSLSRHQRHYSASASLQTTPKTKGQSQTQTQTQIQTHHDGGAGANWDLLKPPPRFANKLLASSHSALVLPLPGTHSTATGTMAASAGVLPPTRISSWPEEAMMQQPVFFPQGEQVPGDSGSRVGGADMNRKSQQFGETAAHPFAAYSALQGAGRVEYGMVSDGRRDSQSPVQPGMYARPRRLSNNSDVSFNSTGTSGSMISRESLQSFESQQSRMRSSSWSSQTSFDSAMSSFHGHAYPSTPSSRPRNYPWQRPAPIKSYRRKTKPNELFAQLPGEVLELILDELKKLHFCPKSSSCATCWMRDVCNVGVSCRKWLKFARTALYEDIQLVGAESAHQRKRYKQLASPRMVLLRRSLRANPTLAAIVHTIKVPPMPQGVTVEEYHNLVATLVMACPNLERLVGFYPNYDHSFSRLFHALSTRRRLKDMTWNLDASPFQRQRRIQSSSGNYTTSTSTQQNLLTPGDLQPYQSSSFLDLHTDWIYLSSLTIHCSAGATLTPDSLLPTTLSYLSSLQTLYLSHLPVTTFNDETLLSLPPLKKLSLSNCPGVSSAGLSSFATHSTAQNLQSLTLIHTDIDSLPALVRIFSNLSNLTTFSLVQSFPPSLPEDTFIWLMPYLASASLRKLHWDILDNQFHSRASAADNILARSITAGGFPELKALRVPCDQEGIFQSLCRPRESADLPGDKYRGGQNHSSTNVHKHGHSTSSFSGHSFPTHSRNGSAVTVGTASSPTSPGLPGNGKDGGLALQQASDLHQARLAAQARLETARRYPRYGVNVIDENGVTIEKYGIAGFIGTVESKISYCLTPDAGGTDESGGLVGIAELMGDGGEELFMKSPAKERKEGKISKKEEKDESAKKREGCTGRWNTYSGLVVDKKDRERWWHTERGRWRGVTLS